VTPAEFRDICDRLGIAPGRFAELCGAAPGSRPGWIRQGEKGDVPPGVAALARIAEGVAGRLPYADLAALLKAEASRLEAEARRRSGA
jgi:hypothetical protein